ncbi:MAG: class I SAM-dependent methyltransferase [Thermonemataceae bacterium]
MTHTVPTQNKRGFTYELSHIGEAFITFCKTASHPVADIGCAYGVATLPALEQGANVIALDINKQHIQELEARVPTALSSQLTTIVAQFPAVDFEKNSLSAVYMSQVLPFLQSAEIQLAVQKIYDWLVPGGKVFLVSFTPYLKHCASYIPVYEEKVKNGEPWAGYIADLPAYSKDNPIADQLPNSIYHADTHDLTRVFGDLFRIDHLDYFGDEQQTLPAWIRHDGRERVGMIATKI